MTYEEEFPRHLGPPPVTNHNGAKTFKATKPTFTVELDSGAFMAVWEHMESQARLRFLMHDYASTGAYLRAVAALRGPYWACHEPPPEPPPEAHARNDEAV